MSYVKQVGGDHYGKVEGDQHWDLMERYDVDYLTACATKYPLRWRSKGGVADLKKSVSYIDKAIACRGPGRGARRLVPVAEVQSLCERMGTDDVEACVVELLLCSGSAQDYEMARRKLLELIEEVEGE